MLLLLCCCSQGCFIGCKECDHESGRRQVDLCNSGQKATVNDPSQRSVNRAAAAGSPEDIYKHNPWRYPGNAPVADVCGLAGGTPWGPNAPEAGDCTCAWSNTACALECALARFPRVCVPMHAVTCLPVAITLLLVLMMLMLPTVCRRRCRRKYHLRTPRNCWLDAGTSARLHTTQMDDWRAGHGDLAGSQQPRYVIAETTRRHFIVGICHGHGSILSWVTWLLLIGGGYQYRLCPASEELTEECFQRHPLEFVREKQAIVFSNGVFSLSALNERLPAKCGPPKTVFRYR